MSFPQKEWEWGFSLPSVKEDQDGYIALLDGHGVLAPQIPKHRVSHFYHDWLTSLRKEYKIAQEAKAEEMRQDYKRNAREFLKSIL